MSTVYGGMSIDTYLRITRQTPVRPSAKRPFLALGLLLVGVGALGGWSFATWNGQGSQRLTTPQAIRELANVDNPQAMRESALGRVYILVKYTHLALKASSPRDYPAMAKQLGTSLGEMLDGDGGAADRLRSQLATASRSSDPDIGEMSSGVNAIIDAYAQPSLKVTAGVYMKRLSVML